MNSPLKKAVNDYLDDFELSDQQLRSFKKLEQGIARAQPHPQRRNILPRLVATAALVILSLIGTSYFQHREQQAQIAAIAEEVSRNHVSLKPLEVASDQLDTVAAYFDKLGFKPKASALVAVLPQSLIGGRYCSIKGNNAAQLRMRDSNGKISTLFETQYNADDFSFLPVLEHGQSALQLSVNGQSVSLWIENGVVMAWVQATVDSH